MSRAGAPSERAKAAAPKPRRFTPQLGRDILRLEGGPMDDVVVKIDAPALHPDWHESWPDDLTRAYRPGRYVKRGTTARWEEYDGTTTTG